MSNKAVMIDRYFALGGYRFSWVANRIVPDFSRSQVDSSSVEELVDVIKKGLHTGNLTIAGAVTVSAEKEAIQHLRAEGSHDLILGLGRGAIVGDPALLCAYHQYDYRPSGELDQLHSFELQCRASTKPYIGSMLWHDAPSGPGTTAIGDGTGVELGAIPAGSEGRFTLMSLLPPGVSGTTPTCDVVLESDVDDTWASPVVRHTFAQIDDDPSPTSETVVIDGDSTPVTDTWWRLRVSAIGGTDTPTFYLFGAGAVQTQ